MAKKNEPETAGKDTSRREEPNTQVQRPEDTEEPKRAGGRTIARWKQEVFKELPNGSDEEIAQRLNELAQEEGYAYRCSATAVARWREEYATPSVTAQAQPQGQEGPAIVMLRQLVALLGKDGVKKLVDSL